jgi:CheY-like chemotaxis protein
VLVVDDQEASRFIVRELLRGRDHEVLEASSGLEGLRMAQRTRPGVILLDLTLGDMEGFDVLESLRNDHATREIPVLVVTSRTVSDAERQRLGLETPVMSKANLSRENLQAAIQRALDLASRAQPSLHAEETR